MTVPILLGEFTGTSEDLPGTLEDYTATLEDLSGTIEIEKKRINYLAPVLIADAFDKKVILCIEMNKTGTVKKKFSGCLQGLSGC